MKDKKIIIGNWKMAPKSLSEAKATFLNIRSIGGKLTNVQTVICAPYVYVGELKKLVTGHRVVAGAQDVSYENDDPHTGEVSVDMLKSIGAEYVIVGHSERRVKGETNEDVSKKVAAVTKKDMTAVICIGENERDEDGSCLAFVKQQLTQSLAGVSKKMVGKIIVAYEPVWAVGAKAKRQATPEDVLEMALYIRRILVDIFGEKLGSGIPILYGGSVDAKNAFSYLNGCEVQGLLVGRVSLKPGVFEKILQIANGY